VGEGEAVVSDYAATDPTGVTDVYIGIMGIVDGIYGYSDEDNYELDDEEYAYVLQDYENFAATMEDRAPRNLIGPSAGPDEHGNIVEFDGDTITAVLDRNYVKENDNG
jgi:hypothetical protein